LTLQPFNQIRDLFDGKTDGTTWAATCRAVRAAAAASC
jgi:hypothetical protein